MSSDDKHYTQILHTSHYEFTLHAYYRCLKGKCTSIHLYVGDNPIYRALSISLPFQMINSYNLEYESTVGKIAHIKKFREALLKPVSDEIWKMYSFPSEMLIRVIDVIRTNFPYIKHLTLYDDSQLECSYNPLDKLDLLYYNTAIHKKTWYEQEFNAYFLPRDNFIQYRCNIENYASSKTKESLSWESIQRIINENGTHMVYTFINTHYEECKKLYDASNTLPTFFKAFAQLFTFEDKCFVFKEWIKLLIKQFIHDEIPREWIIDVYQAHSLQKIPKKGGVRKTRKINTKRK
jgi:hypothetical protein